MIETGSHDTIVAIATPDHDALVGVIRISGAEALPAAERLFHAADGRRGMEDVRWGALKGSVLLGRSGSTLPAVCLIMRGPHSYTGEDVVELHVMGSLVLLDMLLQLSVRYGCRPATAGEFSRRAFLNDRMDLSQMESVGRLINAETEAERRIALKGLAGALGGRITELARRVMTLLTPLELSIDFSDQDIEIVNHDDAAEQLAGLISDIEEMLRSRHSTSLRHGGCRVVIYGDANAGKSTLFNCLLGHEAAITSEEAGTTRDHLEGDVKLENLSVCLVDTAGVLERGGEIDAALTESRAVELASADLVIAVTKGQIPYAEVSALPCPVLKVRTHADCFSSEQLAEFCEADDALWVSSPTGVGIEELQSEIVQRLRTLDALHSGALVLNQRHADALAGCAEALRRARSGLEEDGLVELIAADLREGLHSIELLNGADYDADLLDSILRDFCVGK